MKRVYIGSAAFVVLAAGIWGVWDSVQPKAKDAEVSIPSVTQNQTFTDGPFEVWDAHLSVDPAGLSNVVGVVKNDSKQVVHIKEISVVNSNTVFFDSQNEITLQPNQALPFIVPAQSMNYKSINDGKSLILAYK